MIEINLLPKGYLKGGRGLSLSKAGVYAMAAGAGVVVVLAGITFYQMSQLGQLEENIARAEKRASLLRQDIRMVDALIDVKDNITWRMTAVEELDRHRSAWVGILQDLASNVPEFVWLGAFRELEVEAPSSDVDSGTTPVIPTGAEGMMRPAEVEGFAFTLNSLASFMIKMMRSDYFDDVELIAANEVSFDENSKVVASGDRSNGSSRKAYQFTLSCNVHYLSDEELRTLIASTGKSSKQGTTSTSHKQLN